MRLNRHDLQDIFSEDRDFEIGTSYLIRDEKDIVVFANGIMVVEAVNAAEKLEKDGLIEGNIINSVRKLIN